jgi:hypothetical protein
VHQRDSRSGRESLIGPYLPAWSLTALLVSRLCPTNSLFAPWQGKSFAVITDPPFPARALARTISTRERATWNLWRQMLSPSQATRGPPPRVNPWIRLRASRNSRRRQVPNPERRKLAADEERARCGSASRQKLNDRSECECYVFDAASVCHSNCPGVLGLLKRNCSARLLDNSITEVGSIPPLNSILMGLPWSTHVHLGTDSGNSGDRSMSRVRREWRFHFQLEARCGGEWKSTRRRTKNPH